MSYHLPPSHPPVAREGVCASHHRPPTANDSPQTKAMVGPRRTKAENRCITARWIVRNTCRLI